MALVVFLRGMNLGKRRLTNDELAAAFERLGFANPTPYQASGNVILSDAETVDPGELSAGLEQELGYEVPAFVRSAEAVRALTDSPFAGVRGSEGGKPQIIFLHDAPGNVLTAELSLLFRPDDRFEVMGTEIHWLPAGGQADAGPLLADLDRAVGGTTVRTLGTIERIVRKL